MTTYPHWDGDFLVIGPECFTDVDHTVISFKGDNYYPKASEMTDDDQIPIEKVVGVLAAERKRKGISQVHVAELMETTQSYVSDLERGKVDPRMGTLSRYAWAIGVRLEPVLVERSGER